MTTAAQKRSRSSGRGELLRMRQQHPLGGREVRGDRRRRRDGRASVTFQLRRAARSTTGTASGPAPSSRMRGGSDSGSTNSSTAPAAACNQHAARLGGGRAPAPPAPRARASGAADVARCARAARGCPRAARRAATVAHHADGGRLMRGERRRRGSCSGCQSFVGSAAQQQDAHGALAAESQAPQQVVAAAQVVVHAARAGRRR